MSLSELKQLAQLESRQKNVNKKLNNIVLEETTKTADEPYLTETIDDIAPNEMYVPTFEEIKGNLSEDQINEIYEYVISNIMPDKIGKIQDDLNKVGVKDPELFRNVYDEVLMKEVEKEIDNYVNKKLIEANTLNLGSKRTERLPNETDEQYLERLESIRLSIPDSETIINFRKSQEKNKLRENLSKLMKYSDVEAVINDTDLMTDEVIALLNRIFPKFNKDLRETFKTIDLHTFKDYTRHYVEDFAKNKLGEKEVSSEVVSYDTPKKIPYEFGDVYDNGSEEEEEHDSIDHFNLNYIPPSERQDGVTPLLGTQELSALASISKQKVQTAQPLGVLSDAERRAGINEYLKNKYNKVELIREKIGEYKKPDNPYHSYFDKISLTKTGKRSKPKNRTKGEVLASISSKLFDIETDTGKTPQEVGWGLYKKGQKARHRTFYGKGILLPDDSEDKQFYNFGKFLLDNDKLGHNVVRIIYKSTGINHPKIKNTLVSDDFKDLLLEVVNNSRFTDRNYKKLSKEERVFMKMLLEKSGVAKVLKISDLDEEDDKALMNRMKVIQGELEIGNTSPLLKKEASEIIQHFISNGKISESNGYKMLYNLVF